jgi:predicted MPP superfamily phosphohydrolase
VSLFGKRGYPHPAIDRKDHRLALLAGLASGGLVAGSALAAYTLAVEPYRLELTHPEIPLPTLPLTLDGLSLLLLADTHVARWGRREPMLVEMLEKVERPDLIVWAGDWIQGKVGIPHVLRLCRFVAERFPGVPTFGVLGNAEHKMKREYRLDLVRQLEAAGKMTVLINSHESLTLGGETITIAGVDDPYYGHADIKGALRGAPIGENFTLLLAHSPQVATQAARAGVDLMLSGHTHGGQVRLPLLGPLKTQNPLARRLDQGLFDRHALATVLGRDPGGDLVTYISRGVGVANVPRVWWLTPRLLCRPEVARLVLRRAV